MNEWQPIDTAPMDGTQILVCWKTKIDLFDNDSGQTVCAAVRSIDDSGLWFVAGNSERRIFIEDPTHWMPLPEPPK